MAKFWKEPLDPARHLDFMSGHQDAGGRPIDRTTSDGFVYFVRECSFTFSFATLDQLRDAIAYFETQLHPGRRLPGIHLEHYWQRWYERLPPGLIAGTRRTRILDALGRAEAAFTARAGGELK